MPPIAFLKRSNVADKGADFPVSLRQASAGEGSLKCGMRSVAERHLRRMFAGAPGDSFGLRDFRFSRPQACPLVGTIAKWLALRASTRAPPVGARFHFLHNWTLLENDWFAHSNSMLDGVTDCLGRSKRKTDPKSLKIHLASARNFATLTGPFSVLGEV